MLMSARVRIQPPFLLTRTETKVRKILMRPEDGQVDIHFLYGSNLNSALRDFQGGCKKSRVRSALVHVLVDTWLRAN